MAVVVERVLLGPVSRIRDYDGGAYHQGEKDEQGGGQPRAGRKGPLSAPQTRRAALAGGPGRVSLKCLAQPELAQRARAVRDQLPGVVPSISCPITNHESP
jgi:hypothetical protein